MIDASEGGLPYLQLEPRQACAETARSDADPNRHYVGNASEVDERLEWHNHGPCGFTVSHRPWRLAVSIEFPTELEALRFERYLKSGSGRAFAKRHFGTA